MSIHVNPPSALNKERVTIGDTTVEEILDFIVKYEGILQVVTIQHEIAQQRADELSHQLCDKRAILDEAYIKLRAYLENKVTRVRHT
jgi:hypothetical protein